MDSANLSENDFLAKLTEITEANLTNPQFGVSMLAKEMDMSRSNLHRKVNDISKITVSQLINHIRLKHAMEMLRHTSYTVSDVAHKTGFSNTSYFIKCFHEYYGYTPGEVGNREEDKSNLVLPQSNKKQLRAILFPIVSVIALFTIIFLVFKPFSTKQKEFEKSIIVLPFKNLAREKSDSIFSEGISIDILNQLTKISGLKVLPRTSAERYRGSILSSTEIAKQADVNYILDGDVRRQDNDVRIHVELIEGFKNSILWSENYDRPMKDIFAIQSDISKNVADKLQSILTPEEIKQIEKLQPKNFEAYNNYLMGQYFCLKRDSTSIKKGIEFFNKAIEIDPEYTLAYSGLADGYYALSFTGNIERSSGYDMAYKMAEKALEKDSTLSEAYAVLGVVNYFGYWKWEEARKLFEKALEVDSNCMVAHLYFCSFLDIVGEPDNALKEVNKAIELEPVFHMPYHMKGIIYRNEKKYTESTDAFKRSIELNPSYCPSYYSIIDNFFDLKNEASAIKMLIELFSVKSEYKKYKDDIKPVYENSGINSVLKLYLSVTLEQKNPDDPFLISMLNNMLGKQTEALNYLEKACREKNRDIPRMIRRPEFENLHSNPRFQALVDTMNLRSYFPKPSK